MDDASPLGLASMWEGRGGSQAKNFSIGNCCPSALLMSCHTYSSSRFPFPTPKTGFLCSYFQWSLWTHCVGPQPS